MFNNWVRAEPFHNFGEAKTSLVQSTNIIANLFATSFAKQTSFSDFVAISLALLGLVNTKAMKRKMTVYANGHIEKVYKPSRCSVL